jgi:Fe-S cluster assembly ATP-binding protein
MGILELRDIRLTLGGTPVLRGLSIDFWEGHIHALVGPNGAGKSTVANLIMGLADYRDYEGELLFEGESLRGMDVAERARRGITLAWQEPARFEGLRVRDFLTRPAKDKSEARAKEVLDRVGLAPGRYLDRSVDKTLSGGERKRIELASILAMEPRLILMDEPDSGIDVGALEKIFETLADLEAGGATVILITHSLPVLEQAEHAFLLCRGKLMDKGPVAKIGAYFEDRCLDCDLDLDTECETDATETA